jgi:hypothetical protein
MSPLCNMLGWPHNRNHEAARRHVNQILRDHGRPDYSRRETQIAELLDELIRRPCPDCHGTGVAEVKAIEPDNTHDWRDDDIVLGVSTERFCWACACVESSPAGREPCAGTGKP